MTNFKSPSSDRLFQAILNLESIEECYAFFDDICTIKEIKDMTQRLDTAILLDKEMNYQDISAKTGISSATIVRVNKCLKYGSGGYRKAIDKLKAQGGEL